MSITAFLHLNYARWVVWSFVSLGSVWAKRFSLDRSDHGLGPLPFELQSFPNICRMCLGDKSELRRDRQDGAWGGARGAPWGRMGCAVTPGKCQPCCAGAGWHTLHRVGKEALKFHVSYLKKSFPSSSKHLRELRA